MNLCTSQGILLYDISFKRESVEFIVSLADVRKLREPAKKTHTKLKICEKKGILFFLKMQKKRLAFLCIFFVIVLYASSLYKEVWKITILGNHQVKTEEIKAVLASQGIVLGAQKNAIDFEGCEEVLRERFEDFTWVTVYRKGQEIFVLCKENPYKESDQISQNDSGSQKSEKTINNTTDSVNSLESGDLEEKNPTESVEQTENIGIRQDLVSSVDGYVDRIFVRSGTALVKPGDAVVKGQILILGEVDTKDEWAENQENPEKYCVCADGDVFLSYTKDFFVSAENKQELELETGRFFLVPTINLFGKEYRLTVPKRLPQNIKLAEKNTANLELFKILCPNFERKLSPEIGLLKYNEIAKIEKRYSKEELERSLEAEVVKKLSNLEEKGVQIIQKNVTIESNYKGVTYHCDLLLRKKESQLSEQKYGTISDDL